MISQLGSDVEVTGIALGMRKLSELKRKSLMA